MGRVVVTKFAPTEKRLVGAPAFALLELINPHDPSSIKWLVDEYDGLKIVMHFTEHPPPHFAVEYDGESANFSISDCKRLRNNVGLERHESDIRFWWRSHKDLLIREWNRSRPTNCPVGPIKVPVVRVIAKPKPNRRKRR
jgi:hypothetical protein